VVKWSTRDIDTNRSLPVTTGLTIPIEVIVQFNSVHFNLWGRPIDDPIDITSIRHPGAFWITFVTFSPPFVLIVVSSFRMSDVPMVPMAFAWIGQWSTQVIAWSLAVQYDCISSSYEFMVSSNMGFDIWKIANPFSQSSRQQLLIQFGLWWQKQPSHWTGSTFHGLKQPANDFPPDLRGRATRPGSHRGLDHSLAWFCPWWNKPAMFDPDFLNVPGNSLCFFWWNHSLSYPFLRPDSTLDFKLINYIRRAVCHWSQGSCAILLSWSNRNSTGCPDSWIMMFLRLFVTFIRFIWSQFAIDSDWIRSFCSSSFGSIEIPRSVDSSMFQHSRERNGINYSNAFGCSSTINSYLNLRKKEFGEKRWYGSERFVGTVWLERQTNGHLQTFFHRFWCIKLFCDLFRGLRTGTIGRRESSEMIQGTFEHFETNQHRNCGYLLNCPGCSRSQRHHW
jgi:hypothetical protein